MPVHLVTVDDVMSHAVGLVKQVKGVLSDTALYEACEDSLNHAKDELAEDLETYWEKTVIRQTTDEPGAYVREPGIDYNPLSMPTYGTPRWTTRRRPIISVEEVRLMFNPGATAITIPAEWYRGHVDWRTGTVAILPYGMSGSAYMGAAVWYLPLLQGGMGAHPIPNLVCIDYTAGWYDPAADTLPPGSAAVANGITHAAVLGVMQRVARLIPTSVSTDGFSQTFPNWEREMENNQKEVERFKRWWDSHYRPVSIVMV